MTDTETDAASSSYVQSSQTQLQGMAHSSLCKHLGSLVDHSSRPTQLNAAEPLEPKLTSSARFLERSLQTVPHGCEEQSYSQTPDTGSGGTDEDARHAPLSTGGLN